MRQILYALQFTGSAAAEGDDQTVMQAKTSARGATISTSIVDRGFESSITAEKGGDASFESTIRHSPGGTFTESGTIHFGGNHRLRFSTVGRGAISPSAEDGLMAGAVIWKIDDGEGQLAGATGYITSNFTVNSTGDVTDNQLGVIFVP